MSHLNNRKPDLKAIFIAANELPTSEERAQFLKNVCGDDGGLRSQVEQMLSVAESSQENVLDRMQSALHFGAKPKERMLMEDPSELDSQPEVGPYRLLEKIGEGGMGLVYLAEQTVPFQRRVALKLIKPGMDSQQVVARFEAERQALAMMNHPHIAKVLDGGMDERGRLYFAMELVNGEPITAFCDRCRLDIKSRLQIMEKVCQAVHHAHQRGIIHRDLKPANILVEQRDHAFEPKIIDFGIAKAIHVTLNNESLNTGAAWMIGTPKYMSPEQFSPEAVDLDTRTDVYSLGVILYELLTGSPPFDSTQHTPNALLEFQKMVRESPVTRPSHRVHSLDASMRSAIAEHRSTVWRNVTATLQAELDWIVLKALEKDRNLRYETALEMGKDIGRYLSGDAIIARPPAAMYRLRKFVHRNRGLFAAQAAILGVLILGICGTSWQAVSAMRAVNESERRLRLQKKAEESAKIEAESAEAVNQFFTQELLGQALPEKSPVRHKLTVLEALNRASDRADDALPDKPIIKFAVHKSIGNAFMALGEYQRAAKHFTTAIDLSRQLFGKHSEEVLSLKLKLAKALADQSQFNQAEEVLIDCFDSCTSTLGNGHALTIETMAEMLKLATKQEKETLAAHVFDTLDEKWDVAVADSPSISATTELAYALGQQNKVAEAEALLRRTLKRADSNLPETDPGVLRAKLVLGLIKLNQKLFDDAIEILSECWKSHVCHYGAMHPSTLECEYLLGECSAYMGQFSEAEEILRRNSSACLEVLGLEHPETLRVFEFLARVVCLQDRSLEAVNILTSNRQRILEQLGEHHEKAIQATNLLISQMLLHGEYVDCERLARTNLAAAEKQFGINHSEVLVASSHLESALFLQGRFAEASTVGGNYLGAKFNAKPSIEQLIEMHLMLVRETLRLKDFQLAANLSLESLEIARQPKSLVQPLTKAAFTFLLAYAHIEQQAPADAEPLLRECIAVRSINLRPQHVLVAEAESLLGYCFAHLGRYDEARPLLIERWPVLEQSPQISLLSKSETMGHLTHFFEMQGDAIETLRWAKSRESMLQKERSARLALYAEDSLEIVELDNHLAECLIQLKQYEAAQDLLLSQFILLSHERQFNTQAALHFRIRIDAINQLCDVYRRQQLSTESRTWESLSRAFDSKQFNRKPDEFINAIEAWNDALLQWDSLAKSKETDHLSQLILAECCFRQALIYKAGINQPQGKTDADHGKAIELLDKADQIVRALPPDPMYDSLIRQRIGETAAQRAPLLMATNRSIEACLAFEQAMEIRPHDSWVIRQVCKLLGDFVDAKLGVMQTSIDLAKRVSEGARMQPEYLELLAAVQYRADQIDRAYATLHSMEKHHFALRPRSALIMALIYCRRNQIDDAKAALHAATSLMTEMTNENDGLEQLRQRVISETNKL